MIVKHKVIKKDEIIWKHTEYRINRCVFLTTTIESLIIYPLRMFKQIVLHHTQLNVIVFSHAKSILTI